jgi:hypothetical protein
MAPKLSIAFANSMLSVATLSPLIEPNVGALIELPNTDLTPAETLQVPETQPDDRLFTTDARVAQTRVEQSDSALWRTAASTPNSDLQLVDANRASLRTAHHESTRASNPASAGSGYLYAGLGEDVSMVVPILFTALLMYCLADDLVIRSRRFDPKYDPNLAAKHLQTENEIKLENALRIHTALQDDLLTRFTPHPSGPFGWESWQVSADAIHHAIAECDKLESILRSYKGVLPFNWRRNLEGLPDMRVRILATNNLFRLLFIKNQYKEWWSKFPLNHDFHKDEIRQAFEFLMTLPNPYYGYDTDIADLKDALSKLISGINERQLIRLIDSDKFKFDDELFEQLIKQGANAEDACNELIKALDEEIKLPFNDDFSNYASRNNIPASQHEKVFNSTFSILIFWRSLSIQGNREGVDSAGKRTQNFWNICTEEAENIILIDPIVGGYLKDLIQRLSRTESDHNEALNKPLDFPA